MIVKHQVYILLTILIYDLMEKLIYILNLMCFGDQEGILGVRGGLHKLLGGLRWVSGPKRNPFGGHIKN